MFSQAVLILNIQCQQTTFQHKFILRLLMTFLCIGFPIFHSYQHISKNHMFTYINRGPRKGFWAK